ncbi:MAG: outer membrane protein transport protein [Desulfobacterales bacterium]|nr:outer membrane protein transport protein [Desulfobacterales bacterium]
MKKKSYRKMLGLTGALVMTAALGLTAGDAGATNGMNLEGYGPIALGMGGASFAYDNGTAAMMNNPATLGLSDQGNRVDLAFGFLAPNVDTKQTGQADAHSAADLFLMPAVGWTNKNGGLTYGFGVFGQGGMGAEFSATSFLAKGSGDVVRSEVGVGRAMIPLTYDVNDKLTIGGSFDFVWAGMDVKMAMTGMEFGDMVAALGGTQSQGTATGTMVNGLVASIGTLLDPTGPVNWARFDFSNSSDFTGEAKGYGVAGKIGMVYKVSPTVTLGATYHSKTSLSDLKTDDATVTMSANVDTGIAGGGAPSGTYATMLIPVTGEIAVRNFQWPETYGVGVAFQATKDLLLAVDVKRIMWSDVMEDFTMAFTADPAAQQSGLAAGFGGSQMTATLFQQWDDQTVIALGAAYRVNKELIVRAGYNHATNPVPDTYLNYLFPAIEESHVTAGLGYRLSENSGIDLAVSRALKVEAANPNPFGAPVVSEHEQWSGQIMYTLRF